MQVYDQRNKNGRDVLYKTGIADQLGKLRSAIFQNVFSVIGFEVSIVDLLESNQDGQFFTARQGTIALALFYPADKQIRLPVGQRCFAKIIDITEDFE